MGNVSIIRYKENQNKRSIFNNFFSKIVQFFR
jgi:hypothetical protein